MAVWIDMENAFNSVWTKAQAASMWSVRLYDEMDRAIPHQQKSPSTAQWTVHQTTLFLIFINDIVKDLLRNVLGAIYTDDLVLWCTEEHATTANVLSQEALKKLDQEWLATINEGKTTPQPVQQGTESNHQYQRPHSPFLRPSDSPWVNTRPQADLEATY